ncbi:phosphotransferase enzyme family protein [Kribbella sp. GL6]|uniref:phosphotransferase enzyme family protein n=1 Tax=Kribbella sp. GL6 TaxID=3419765 RepID=UPI003CFEE4EE
MTKDGNFKKVVRRHAEETGQRYTEALTDLEGLTDRIHHEPDGDRLLVHLRNRYGIDAVAATKLSVHKTYVFRIDRTDGPAWIARAFPPARSRSDVEGDAAVLRFLARHDYPAERLAVDDAVSDFDGSAVLVTEYVESTPLPDEEGFAIMADLLGRLHALPYDETVSRPGGASGEDPRRMGTPRQDLLAGLAFLDAVDTKVGAADRERFEQLLDQVRSADDAEGLPEGLLHGNLLHAPNHAIIGKNGPVAINWKASGRGARLSDLAFLLWGTGNWAPTRSTNEERVEAVVAAYRKHVELTDEELDRLEGVMYIRPLYLVCFGYRRDLTNGVPFDEWWFLEPAEYFTTTAAAARKAFRR